MIERCICRYHSREGDGYARISSGSTPFYVNATPDGVDRTDSRVSLPVLLYTSQPLLVMPGIGENNRGRNDLSPDSFKEILKKLVQSPNDFDSNDCLAAFKHLCANAASEAQVSTRDGGNKCRLVKV